MKPVVLFMLKVISGVPVTVKLSDIDSSCRTFMVILESSGSVNAGFCPAIVSFTVLDTALPFEAAFSAVIVMGSDFTERVGVPVISAVPSSASYSNESPKSSRLSIPNLALSEFEIE